MTDGTPPPPAARTGVQTPLALAGAVTVAAVLVVALVGQLQLEGVVDGTADVAAARWVTLAAAAVAVLAVTAAGLLVRARVLRAGAVEPQPAAAAPAGPDLREPLAAVVGLHELLLGTALDDTQRELVDTAAEAARGALRSAGDAWTLARLECGELVPEQEPFAVRRWLETTVAQAVTEARLFADVDPDCPELVRGDAERLRQALLPLLEAVSAAGPRTAVVRVRALRVDEDPEALLQLSIAVDAGSGRPLRPGPGAELSGRLARALGGSVHYPDDGGAVLTAQVRGHRDQRRPDPDAPESRLAGRGVLVVDDNETSRRSLFRQLRSWGLTCSAVAGPVEALALLGTGAAFDVVLVDLKMPGELGRQLAADVRSLPYGAELPLVLLTGPARFERLEPDLYDVVLSGPARTDGVRSALLRLLAPVETALREVETLGGSRVDDGVGAPRPLHVLLVEDDHLHRRVGQLQLAQLGHTVDTVANGRAAVAAVRGTRYDVVLMDLELPELDGLAATRQIRAERPAAEQPCIVALTSGTDHGRRQAVRAAGMDSSVAKPLRLAELGAVLGAVDLAALRRDDRVLVPAGPAGREGGLRVRLAELRGPDPAGTGSSEHDAIVARLLRGFLESAPGTLAAMQEAASHSEGSQVAWLAGSLQSAASDLGAAGLAELCGELADRARSGRLDELGELLGRAWSELDELTPLMSALAAELGRPDA